MSEPEPTGGPLPQDLAARLAGQPVSLPTGPSQISVGEVRLLSWLAEHRVTGRGVCVDAGCGTGGSSHAIATGLSRNPRIGATPNRLPCFDRFLFDPESYRGGNGFATVEGRVAPEVRAAPDPRARARARRSPRPEERETP